MDVNKRFNVCCFYRGHLDYQELKAIKVSKVSLEWRGSLVQKVTEVTEACKAPEDPRETE
jgi:hypothetical protein